jgi:malonyl-CoA O-methyltransferase
MNTNQIYFLAKKEIIRSFNHAAESYDAVAILQREVADRLLERLDYIRIQPKIILDLGSGTGYCARLLESRYKKAKIIAVDIAEQMLAKNKNTRRWFDRKRYICGDIENLPIASKSADLVFSNLALHWCGDIEKAVHEMQRILKPGGLLLFSTLGRDTLYELRQSWAEVDREVHVHKFVDMHDVGDCLQRSQLKDPVVDMEFIAMTYNDFRKILLDLKDLGTHNIARGRAKGLTGKNKFHRFVQSYEKFRNAEGLIPVTYEIIYGHAWGGEEVQKSQKKSEVVIPITAIANRKG